MPPKKAVIKKEKTETTIRGKRKMVVTRVQASKTTAHTAAK